MEETGEKGKQRRSSKQHFFKIKTNCAILNFEASAMKSMLLVFANVNDVTEEAFLLLHNTVNIFRLVSTANFFWWCTLPFPFLSFRCPPNSTAAGRGGTTP